MTIKFLTDCPAVFITDKKILVISELHLNFSKTGIGINLTNLFKEGFLDEKCKRDEYLFRLTEKGDRTKNILQNLSHQLKNLWGRLESFNSLLEKFELGKIEIDENMRIITKWFE